MDAKAIQALRERFEAPRRFDAPALGRTFHMLIPSPFEERRIMLAVKGDGWAAVNQVLRDMTVAAVTGWDGVTYADLFGDSDDSPLPYSAEVADLLLAHRLDLLDELTDALSVKKQARREVADEEGKKSRSGSNGISASASEGSSTPPDSVP